MRKRSSKTKACIHKNLGEAWTQRQINIIKRFMRVNAIKTQKQGKKK